MTSASIWTQHQLLGFPDLRADVRYSLPFFAHRALGDLLFTTRDGQPLPYCEDSIYQAVDHRLLWLDSALLKSSTDPYDRGGMLSVYFGGLSNLLASPRERPSLHVQQVAPEEVMLVAEFFRDASMSNWQTTQSSFSISKRPATCNSLRAGNAISLCSKGGSAALISRQVMVGPSCVRLHLRAHFYDAKFSMGENHWVSVQSGIGCGAIGVAPEIEDNYAFSCSPSEKWQRTVIRRSLGWHLFEIMLENGNCVPLIDGEPIKTSTVPLAPACNDSTITLELGALGSGRGVWGGIELLHTPEGEGTWEMGVQSVMPHNRRPWRIHQQAEGKWTISSAGQIEKLPKDDEPTAITIGRVDTTVQEPLEECVAHEEIVEERCASQILPDAHSPKEEADDIAALIEPTVEGVETKNELSDDSTTPMPTEVGLINPAKIPRRPKSRAKHRPVRRPLSPPPPTGLTIECWSLPVPEERIALMDRVMNVFLDKLREAGVVLPENILRLEACGEAQHPDCYIYSFGTRRLHVASREGEDGRISLVVRCGGGFLDFTEFAKRHGNLEQLKLQRRLGSACNQTIQLVSVMSQGSVHVKERLTLP